MCRLILVYIFRESIPKSTETAFEKMWLKIVYSGMRVYGHGLKLSLMNFRLYVHILTGLKLSPVIRKLLAIGLEVIGNFDHSICLVGVLA